MSPPPAGPAAWGGLPDDLAADVRRVSDRLRTLSVAQLAAPPAGWSPEMSRADAGRIAAGRLAAAAEALEAAGAGRQPVERPRPRLDDFAVGDQVAVTGHDLLAAIPAVDPAAGVWLDFCQRTTARQAVSDAAKVLADARRSL